MVVQNCLDTKEDQTVIISELCLSMGKVMTLHTRHQQQKSLGADSMNEREKKNFAHSRKQNQEKDDISMCYFKLPITQIMSQTL